MNKHKISPQLLNQVNILSTNNKNYEKNFKNNDFVFVFSNNFKKTEHFLTYNKIFYTAYPFINCFCVHADLDDLNILSYQDEIFYINTNANVQALSKEQDFINLSALTENKYFGKGVTICFIDTGIFPHLDFIFPRNKIIKFVDLINNKSEPYDDNGHGTFVSGICSGSGIFSASKKGIASEATIISIKALKSSGESNSNVILDAMQWIYENHKKYNISIVCMSFGADYLDSHDPLSKGAQALWDIGITVVAAAGNSGPKANSIKSPGTNPKIITVGALDISKLTVADFSSRGPTIYGNKPDLLAPAVNLISCNYNSLPYTLMSGTSVATPIVAGVCAIIKQKHPRFTNNQIKKYLLYHCIPITHNINIEGHGYLKF